MTNEADVPTYVGFSCWYCHRPLFRQPESGYLLCGACPRPGERVMWADERKPVKGVVVGVDGPHIEVQWDDSRNAPYTCTRRDVRVVGLLERLADI